LADSEPEHATARNRLFVACVVLTPLFVYIWSALEHTPRPNWTAPLWLATLPMLSWVLVHARSLRSLQCQGVFTWLAQRLPVALLVLDAALLYHVVLGIPGLPYPASFGRAVGWATAAQHLRAVYDQLGQATGVAPVVVGMDNYFIAAQLSNYAAGASTGAEAREASRGDWTPMRVTNQGAVLGGQGLMFSYWDAPQQFAGRAFIMVARSKEVLQYESLARHFTKLEPEIHSRPLMHDGPAGNRKPVGRYYYRIGYGYHPDDRAAPAGGAAAWR
jgi:hypothetical protein